MRAILLAVMIAMVFVAQTLSVADAEERAAVGAVEAKVIGSEQPQVQATCDGVPIKRFGFCWVLGEAPDLLDDVTLQLGNANPRVKVHPKDSSQIKRNYLGVTTTRMPRSTENDYLPLEAIHLIDGNLQTCWMSRSQTRPDVQPIWIRLDLPVEREVDRIVLRKRPPADQPRSTLGWVPFRDAAEVGRGMPATITIKTSRDNRHGKRSTTAPRTIPPRSSTSSSASPAARPSRSGSRRATCLWSKTSSMPSPSPR